MARKKQKSPDEMRGPILDAVLPHVAFDGWSEKAIKIAADELGITRAFIKLSFPGGAAEMVGLLMTRTDEAMLKKLKRKKLADMRIRDRIRACVMTRILCHENEKEMVWRTLAFLALPENASEGARHMWRAADLMWRAAGDTSTDYNHYSKRAILSGVFGSTLLYWLNDDSEKNEDSWAFLDRRIENVMQFEKLKGKAKKFTDKLPNLARNLGSLRYPDRHP